MSKKKRVFEWLLICATALQLMGCDTSPGDVEVEASIPPGTSFHWWKFDGNIWAHSPPYDASQNPIIWQSAPGEPGKSQSLPFSVEVCMDDSEFENGNPFEQATTFEYLCNEAYTTLGAEAELDELFGSDWFFEPEDVYLTYSFNAATGDVIAATPKWLYAKCKAYLDADMSVPNLDQHLTGYESTGEICDESLLGTQRSYNTDSSWGAVGTEQSAPSDEMMEDSSLTKSMAMPVQALSFSGVLTNDVAPTLLAAAEVTRSQMDVTLHIDGHDIKSDDPIRVLNPVVKYGFDTKPTCNAASCTASLGAFDASLPTIKVSNDNGTAYLTGATYKLYNRPLGTYNLATKEVEFEAGDIKLMLEGVWDGDQTNQLMSNKGDVVGVWDPENDYLRMEGRFGGSDISLNIVIIARYTKTPPTAQITAPDVVECNDYYKAHVLVDGNSLPYGDTKQHHWWVQYDNGIFVPQSVEKNPTITVPLGDHSIRHRVYDADLVWDETETSMLVEDTSGPTIEAPAHLTFSTCNSAQQFDVKEPVVSDLCSLNIETEGYVISKNGDALTSPLQIVDESVVLGPGEYVIGWTATDEFGNSSYATQTVNVKSGIRTMNALTLHDRSTVVLPGGEAAPVFNSGTGNTHVGRSAIVGTVTSNGDVVVSDYSIVEGDVITNGSIAYQNRDTITIDGVTSQNAGITFGGLVEDDLAWVVFPPTNAQNLVFDPRELPYNLLPGSYPYTLLNSGSTVILSAGVYYFNSLIVNDASEIIVDDSEGDVTIFIENGLNLVESFTDYDGNVVDVFVGMAGYGYAHVEASFSGTFVAPNAIVILGAAFDNEFVGRYVAGELELAPDVELTCMTDNMGPAIPEESCYDNVLNQDETDVDCGGICAGCVDGKQCDENDDCLTGDCIGGVCQTSLGECNESMAIDLGQPGVALSVSNAGCVMIRDAYPDWWGERNIQLQTMEGGTFPAPYIWTNSCSGGMGTGTFSNSWQSDVFGPTNDACATIIDLGGDGSGNITLRYYGN